MIVPDFGGFVANYSPAKIHPVLHQFTPPSKSIIFNKMLKNNDGLLASHIAAIEKISFPEALKYINHFVENANLQLKKGAKITLEEIGTLYLDTERNIQFEPETANYLLEAFGLPDFQSPPIKRDTISRRIEKEFIDRGAIPAEKKKSRIKTYIAVAVALPLVFALIWIPLKTDLLKNINYSSLNPFVSKEAAKYTEREKTKSEKLKIENSETASFLKMNDTARQARLNINDNVSLPVTADMIGNKTAGLVKVDSTSVSVRKTNISDDFKFHLISGCFLIKDNADKFVTTLQSQNYTASIIGKRNGLYVVSSGDYPTRQEASSQLIKLKKNQPEAWLLVK